MNTSVLVGIGAGLVSSALFASAWTGTLLGVFVLFFLSPFPVAIAGLGWGWGAGAVAAAVGSIVVAIIGTGRSGVMYALSLGAPAAVFAYYTLLNRVVPAADGSGEDVVEWYPLGRIVAYACVWAGVLATLSMLTMGGDVDSIRRTLAPIFERMVGSMTPAGGRQLTAEEKNAIVAVATLFYPWAIATIWLTVAVWNWWLAAKVVEKSGRLVRPWEDLAQFRLPPQFPLAFAVATLASFVTTGFAMLVVTGFISALMFGFMLVGLAIIHRVSRGSTLRPFLLSAVYVSLIFVQVTILLVAMLGLIEPWLRGRQAGSSDQTRPPGAA